MTVHNRSCHFSMTIIESKSLCRLLGLLILSADVIFILIDIFLKNEESQMVSTVVFQLLDLVFSAYFCVEVSLRIIGLGYVWTSLSFPPCSLLPPPFFHSLSSSSFRISHHLFPGGFFSGGGLRFWTLLS